MGQGLNVTNTHIAVKIKGMILGKVSIRCTLEKYFLNANVLIIYGKSIHLQLSDNLLERPGFLTHKIKSCKMTLLNFNLQFQSKAFKTPARRASARKVICFAFYMKAFIDQHCIIFRYHTPRTRWTCVPQLITGLT
jgi:hypothetical protein